MPSEVTRFRQHAGWGAQVLQQLLPPGHPCTEFSYRQHLDINTVQGTWYVLVIICSSWNRVPLCDKVELHGNSTLLHETWTSLDLLSDPHYRHGAVYSTDLAVVEPGCWKDLRPERAHPVTLVLDADELLVLAQCYQGDYATPYHDHEVFILGRNTKGHLLDQTLSKLAANGLDTRQAQVLQWSMCPNH
ncbi:uncharacterized protein LOC110829619 isoform X2 [Zootermopsis nevadensis]|uniref:uncharacterized protein LOC110829619 isoform X2 n=1 Tax=Zootermopsis nevadensis TaxID=136037 RepID=UPI000B8E6942|nr:uncharacterized protein LOC110829619 isoform X2 [Zootermopsis nevadensis]